MIVCGVGFVVYVVFCFVLFLCVCGLVWCGVVCGEG